MTVHTIDFRYAPPKSWTSICRPDDPYKSLVSDGGALLYGFEDEGAANWHFRRVIEFGIQSGHGPTGVRQQTESARIPVVVTTLDYARATLELRTFAHLDGERRTDLVLWTITAHDDVDEVLTGIHLDAYERDRAFIGRTAAPNRAIFAADPGTQLGMRSWTGIFEPYAEDTSVPGPGELAFVSSPQPLLGMHPTGFRPCTGLGMEPVILGAGESVSGAIILPLNYGDETGLTHEWALRALDTERAFWNSLPLPALDFEVPDADVMDMFIACARNILQAREIKDGLPVFQVGPTVYRGLWVVDGHFLLEAAQYLGYRNDAEAAIDTLLKRVKPSGAIIEMEAQGHTKETGIAVATLVRQCELLGDDARLRSLWPTIRNAIAYIEKLRDEARALPADDPCYNLLPLAFGDGGIGGHRGEYTTTFWILFGLKSAADTAKRLGYGDDAARFQADFDSLMADFRTHAARNQKTLADGTPYLPLWFPGSGDHHWLVNHPEPIEPFHRLQPESGTWALCQSIWPGEVFAPDDPIVQNLNALNDLRDDEEGIPATTGWLPYKALWNYHASFAAHVWLYSGRPDKAVDYLYDFANHAYPTRIWREEHSLQSSDNGLIVGEMPHNWASAEFIRLLRHLLVFERGETLELLPALPPEWIKPGAIVRLERTPTRFGPISLTLTSSDGATVDIDVTLDPSWPRQPQHISVRLPGAAHVTLNGQPASVAADGWLTLPTGEHAQIRAQVR